MRKMLANRDSNQNNRTKICCVTVTPLANRNRAQKYHALFKNASPYLKK